MKNHILATALILCACITYGDDWPQFNGPNRDNISAETGLLKQWPEAGPNLLWANPGFGAGYATVSVANGTIYTTGKVGDDMIVFAVNLDGTIKWQVPNGPAWGESYAGTRCTPTVEGDFVYVISGKGRVACLQVADGAEVWAVDVRANYDGAPGPWGHVESPLIDGDNIIATANGGKATVVALNKGTGAEVWKSEALNHTGGYVSPIAVTRGEKRLIIGNTGLAIFGIDASDGQMLWQFDLANEHGINAQTPLHHDGHIYTTSGWDVGSLLVKLSEDGTTATEVWRNKGFDNCFGGVIFRDGHFYGFNWINNSRGQFVCVELESGETKHSEFAPGRTNKGAITWADGMVYCYDEGGEVWLGTVDPTAVNIVSRFEITQGGDSHWAYPVVSNGVLYIRHGEVLHAFDVKGE